MCTPLKTLGLSCAVLIAAPTLVHAAEVVSHRITVSVSADGTLRATDRVQLNEGGDSGSLVLGTGYAFAEGQAAGDPVSWVGSLSPRGAVVRAEAGWFPRGDEAVSRFDIKAGDLPEGWVLVPPAPGKAATGVPLVVGPWGVTKVRHGRLRLSICVWHPPGHPPGHPSGHPSGREVHEIRRLLARVGKQLDSLTALIGPFPFSRLSLVEHPLAEGLQAPGLVGLTPAHLGRLIEDPTGLQTLLVEQWLGQAVIAGEDPDQWVEGIRLYLTEPGFGIRGGELERAEILRRAGYDRAEAARAGSGRKQMSAELAALTLLALARSEGEGKVVQALRELFAKRAGSLFRKQDLHAALAGVLGRARLGNRLTDPHFLQTPALSDVPANLARGLDRPAELVVVAASRGRRMERIARNLAGQIAGGRAAVVSARDVTAERLNSTQRVWIVGRPGPELIRRTGLVLPHDLLLGEKTLAIGGSARSGQVAGLAVALEHGTPGEGVLVLLDAFSAEGLEAGIQAIDRNRSHGWLLVDSHDGVEYGLPVELERTQLEE